MTKKKQTLAGSNLVLREVNAEKEAQGHALLCNKNIVMFGSAGTGKTFLSAYKALKDIADADKHRLIIVRSIIQTGKDPGALPGTIEEKVGPFETPYEDIFTELFGRGDAYGLLKKKGFVEFIPTSFIRGTTWDNCCVLVDECQNMTAQELDTIVTRIGKNTKIFICGDYDQADLQYNGMRWFFEILEQLPEHFSFVEFRNSDIVRSGLVKDYIITKNRLRNG